MRPLLKVMFILICIFGSTFLLGRVLGILTVENVRFWLSQAAEIDATYVVAGVLLLLFADLFIAVPTLTITLLAGYFLGFPLGGATAFAGMSSAALAGYAISRKWGEKGISFLIRDEAQRDDLSQTFLRSGPAMIILSRAAPMIPEVTACMAGATRMPFWRYCLYFGISTLPYVAIAAYAGSISSLEDPKPAIWASLFLYATLWLGWALFRRNQKKRLAA